MAVLTIARMGNPILRRRAEEIADPTAGEIRTLIADMIETMHAVDGAGLAAPQVFVPKRLVIFHVPPERISQEPGAEPMGLTILINPAVEPLGDEKEPGWEGCLSVPGLRGVVPRHTHVRYTGLTPEGKRIEREATGFHARVVQHECDHLDGILYPMRMTDLSLLSFTDELDNGLAQEIGVRRDSAGSIE